MQLDDDFLRVVLANTPGIPGQPISRKRRHAALAWAGRLARCEYKSIARYESGAYLRSDSNKSGAKLIVPEAAFPDESGLYQTELWRLAVAGLTGLAR